MTDKGCMAGALCALLVGCGEEPEPAADACAVQTTEVALEVQGDLAYDAPATVEARGADPGAHVTFWWSGVDASACTCVEDGGCLALDHPARIGEATADEDGVARLTWTLAPDAAMGMHRLQALTDQGASAVARARVSGLLQGERQLEDAHHILHGPGIGGVIVGLGDLDRSGHQQVALAAPTQGELWVVEPTCCARPGASVTELAEATHLVGPPSLGAAVTGLGDVSGDFLGDLAVAAPDSGEVWLLHGPLPAGTHSVDDLAALHLEVPGAGRSLASLDANGDGVRELLIAGPTQVWIAPSSGPALDVAVAQLHEPTVTAVGDLDGDGLEDAVITSGDDLVVFYGPRIAERGLSLPGATAARVGDLDGDGYDDVLIGGPDALDGRGVVTVLYGPMNPLSTMMEGAEPGEALGRHIAGAGDLDGDGQGDVLVHSPSEEAVLLLYGPVGTHRSPSQADARIHAPSPAAVAGPGDLDGDGFASVAIGISPAAGQDTVYFLRGGPGW